MKGFFAWLGRVPSAILVFFQLVQIVGYPFVGDSVAGRIILAILSVVVVLVAVWVVRRTPSLTWVAALLALPALVFGLIDAVAPGNVWIFVLGAIFHVLFYFYVTWSLIRYLFHDARITTDELFATLAAFTVVIWAFAYLFLLTETFWPGSFGLFAGADNPFFAALFLSTTTLSSVGLSDILPTSDQGRAIMMIAEIVGLFYMAIIVSRIISISVTVARGRKSN
jgi:hypothetical protein